MVAQVSWPEDLRRLTLRGIHREIDYGRNNYSPWPNRNSHRVYRLRQSPGKCREDGKMALVRADAIDVADIFLLPFNGVRVSFSFTLFGGRAIVLID